MACSSNSLFRMNTPWAPARERYGIQPGGCKASTAKRYEQWVKRCAAAPAVTEMVLDCMLATPRQSQLLGSRGDRTKGEVLRVVQSYYSVGAKKGMNQSVPCAFIRLLMV
jgi:hypothetical protein